MMIDAQFLQSTFGSKSPQTGDALGPQGEVWAAFSVVSGYDTAYIFAANLAEAWSIAPVDIFKGAGSSDQASMNYIVSEANSTETVAKWNSDEPLVLQACSLSDFALWTAAPVLSNGWAFLGEVKKWVGVSAARFSSITATSEGVSVSALGTAGEVVAVNFVTPGMEVQHVSCTVTDPMGSVVISSDSDGSCTTTEDAHFVVSP